MIADAAWRARLLARLSSSTATGRISFVYRTHTVSTPGQCSLTTMLSLALVSLTRTRFIAELPIRPISLGWRSIVFTHFHSHSHSLSLCTLSLCHCGRPFTRQKPNTKGKCKYQPIHKKRAAKYTNHSPVYTALTHTQYTDCQKRQQ